FMELSIKGKTKRLKIFPPISTIDQPLPAGELLYQNGQLLIGCGNQSLILSEVQPEGSKRMPAAAFANSL
ncbi:MAG: hypothetical protein ACK49X_00110, partial [Akkermansiaceae bacterium]